MDGNKTLVEQLGATKSCRMEEMGLRQSTIEKLNRLPREKLIEVRDFIDFLTLHPRQRQTSPDTLPAPDAFLECAGTWEFEPGELEQILQDIDQSRLMELDEEHGGLSD